MALHPEGRRCCKRRRRQPAWLLSRACQFYPRLSRTLLLHFLVLAAANSKDARTPTTCRYVTFRSSPRGPDCTRVGPSSRLVPQSSGRGKLRCLLPQHLRSQTMAVVLFPPSPPDRCFCGHDYSQHSFAAKAVFPRCNQCPCSAFQFMPRR
jgi:hypothetical protein